MTIDHPLRRMLARVCSDATMSRIVDPILADARWEDGRVTVRGVAALARALAFHAVMSFPSWLVAVCSDDEHAVVKATVFALSAAIIAAITLGLQSVAHFKYLKGVSLASLALMATVPAIVFTLPSAIVVAIPLALRRLPVTKRIIRRAVSFSAVAVALNFAVAAGVMPYANQAFTITTDRARFQRYDVTLYKPHSPNEMTLPALRAEIGRRRQMPGAEWLARVFEYVFQQRLAFVTAAIPFGIAGLALATITSDQRRRLLLAVAVLVAYWTMVSLGDRVERLLLFDADTLWHVLCAWLPNAILLVVSGVTLALRHTRSRLSTANAA
jgi:hypothetical protein